MELACDLEKEGKKRLNYSILLKTQAFPNKLQSLMLFSLSVINWRIEEGILMSKNDEMMVFI